MEKEHGKVKGITLTILFIVPVLHIAVGDKTVWGGANKICPNMTNLVGKFHVINCLN